MEEVDEISVVGIIEEVATKNVTSDIISDEVVVSLGVMVTSVVMVTLEVMATLVAMVTIVVTLGEADTSVGNGDSITGDNAEELAKD